MRRARATTYALGSLAFPVADGDPVAAEADVGSSSGGIGAGSGFGVGTGCGHGSGFGVGEGVGVGVGRSVVIGVEPGTKVFVEVVLASTRCVLRRVHRVPHVLPLLQRRDAVRDAGGDARDLLDRLRDRGRDRANGRVGAVGHRDRAVGDRVHLVELVVDAIDGATGLDDDGQHVALGTADEARDPVEELTELEEREERADAEQDEKDRERPVGDVTGGECERHRAGSYPVPPVITPAPTTASSS